MENERIVLECHECEEFAGYLVIFEDSKCSETGKYKPELVSIASWIKILEYNQSLGKLMSKKFDRKYMRTYVTKEEYEKLKQLRGEE